MSSRLSAVEQGYKIIIISEAKRLPDGYICHKMGLKIKAFHFFVISLIERLVKVFLSSVMGIVKFLVFFSCSEVNVKL